VTADSTDFCRKAPPDRGASSFIYPPTPANLKFFAEALKAGCIVAIPTETVYGLAAMALNPKACRSIFAIKGRPLMDPLIVHVTGREMAEELAYVNPSFQKLAEVFWPGPLTLILKKRGTVPDIVTAGRDTVALRMPRHAAAADLLKILQSPLAAPSANPFGYVSPSLPSHVSDSFGSRVPFIIDGGPCEIGLESTILDLTGPGMPVILRPGAIGASEISKVIGLPVQSRLEVIGENIPAKAPGTMARHYSPKTRIHLFEGEPAACESGAATIYLKRPAGKDSDKDTVFWLSDSGDPAEMARALFALLRKLDEKGFEEIRCEVPGISESGVAEAVRDRLIRAARQ